ncbi:MAG: hypothetical protein NVS9B4_00740 [Candidatus Acidiferrum sp.]
MSDKKAKSDPQETALHFCLRWIMRHGDGPSSDQAQTLLEELNPDGTSELSGDDKLQIAREKAADDAAALAAAKKEQEAKDEEEAKKKAEHDAKKAGTTLKPSAEDEAKEAHRKALDAAAAKSATGPTAKK